MKMMMDNAENVSNFILKLWKMLKNRDTVEIMSWNSNGKSFIIKSQIAFISKLLPIYFKHNNLGSFIRQLNLYDFHKICLDNKGTEVEYHHKYFQEGRPELLKFIKRKLPKIKRAVYADLDQEELENVSKEMTFLKAQQEMTTKKLSSLQKENSTLLKEMTNLYVKYNAQSQVLKKMVALLIPFMEAHNNKNWNETKHFDLDLCFARKLQEIDQEEWNNSEDLSKDGNENLQIISTIPTTINDHSLNSINLNEFKAMVKDENPIVTFMEEDDHFSDISDGAEAIATSNSINQQVSEKATESVDQDFSNIWRLVLENSPVADPTTTKFQLMET